jgi:hypothetical protein
MSPKIEWQEHHGAYWFFRVVIEDENIGASKEIRGEINKWREDYFSWEVAFRGLLPRPLGFPLVTTDIEVRFGCFRTPSTSTYLSTEGNAQSLEAAQAAVPAAFQKMLQEQIAKRELEIEIFREALSKIT